MEFYAFYVHRSKIKVYLKNWIHNIYWLHSRFCKRKFEPWDRLKPSSKIVLLTVPRQYFFCGSVVLFMSCVWPAFASVHCCLVVTCWERSDLLALVCDVKLCFMSLSHVVSWVRSGTWLCRFLIFATFLTLSSLQR